MSPSEPTPNDPTARLVRATLEHDAADVDVAHTQSRIRAKLAAQGHSSSTPRSASILGGVLQLRAKRAVLAALLLVVACLAMYLSDSPAPVQAFALVESAQRMLPASADREYLVTIDENNPLPFLTAVDEIRLWTRGDRFRLIFRRGDRSVLWGQDEERRIWIVSSAAKGLSFEANEVPPDVGPLISYLRLDIRHLTDQILHNCTLSITEDTHKQHTGMKTVHATPRQRRNEVEFSTAELDIDETTKVIHRLQLTRRVNGVDQGRFLFTFVGAQPQADESYRLSAHLKEGAQVLTKSRFHARMLEMLRVIGEFNKN